MSESTAVAVVQEHRPTIFELGPKAMVEYGSQMATALKDVIERQNLYTKIQGKSHVRVEGWTTLGAMLGFVPREVEVKELSDGSYEAIVELYNLKTGEVVGRASALCGVDEKRWQSAERYARRSMAVTRATGKAYRLGFSWIMTLAGYEPTPFEEMPLDGVPVQQQERVTSPTPAAAVISTPAPRQVQLSHKGAGGEFVVTIGKELRGKRLDQIPPERLRSFIHWIVSDSEKKRTAPSASAQELIEVGTRYLNSLVEPPAGEFQPTDAQPEMQIPF